MPGSPFASPTAASAAQVMAATNPTLTTGGPLHRHTPSLIGTGGAGGLTVPRTGSVTVPQPSMRNLDSLTPRVAKAVRDGLHGAAVYMDGQQVGKLLVRQGNLQRATR
jgi:hypothetical protein